MKEDRDTFIKRNTVAEDLVAGLYVLHRAVESGSCHPDFEMKLRAIGIVLSDDINSLRCMSSPANPGEVEVDRGHGEAANLAMSIEDLSIAREIVARSLRRDVGPIYEIGAAYGIVEEIDSLLADLKGRVK